MRWTLIAPDSQRSDSPRERFSTFYSVAGTLIAFILLLILLFPKERLLDILNKSNAGDPASVRYLESLLRVQPGDDSLRIRLANELLRVGNPRKALVIMTGFSAKLLPADNRNVLEMRYRALKELLLADGATGERQNLQSALAETARELAHDNPPQWKLRHFAEDARKTGDLASWRYFNRRADLLEIAARPAGADATPADPFALALGAGNYQLAASICFSAMPAAASHTERRQLFFKGVRTLQSGNLALEALEAGERHLGSLGNDRETLIFLTRVGLAAGKPERAQRFIRRALQMKEKPAAAEVS